MNILRNGVRTTSFGFVDLLIYLYIFLMPLETLLTVESEEMIIMNTMKPLGLFVFFCWGIRFVMQKRAFNIKEVILPLVFSVIGLFSASWAAYDSEISLSLASNIVSQVGLFFMMYHFFNNPEKVINSYKAYTCGAVVASVMTLMVFFRDPSQRAAIYGANQGIYPTTIIIGLFFLLYSVSNCKRMYTKLGIGIMLVIVYLSGVASGTRSFFYSSLLFMPLASYKLFTIEKGWQIGRKAFGKIFLLIGVLALSGALINPIVGKSALIRERYMAAFQSRGFQDRLFAIENTYLALLHNPLLGVGLGNYPYFLYSKKFAYMESHNVFVTILQELGIIGFLVFLGFYYRIFKKSLNLYSNLRADNKFMLVTVFSFLMVTVSAFSEPILKLKCLWLILAQVLALNSLGGRRIYPHGWLDLPKGNRDAYQMKPNREIC